MAHREAGGPLVVMDLVKHRFEEARDMYADVWLGFSEVELVDMFKGPGSVSRYRLCIGRRRRRTSRRARDRRKTRLD